MPAHDFRIHLAGPEYVEFHRVVQRFLMHHLPELTYEAGFYVATGLVRALDDAGFTLNFAAPLEPVEPAPGLMVTCLTCGAEPGESCRPRCETASIQAWLDDVEES